MFFHYFCDFLVHCNTLQTLKEIGDHQINARPNYIQTLGTGAYLDSAWSKGLADAICLKQFCPQLKSPLDRCGLASERHGLGRHSVTVNQWHDPIESEAIKYTSGQLFVVILILFVSS